MILKTTDSEGHVHFVPALFGTEPEEQLCNYGGTLQLELCMRHGIW